VTADGPGETCTGPVSQGFCDIAFTAPGNDRDVLATYEGDGRFEADSDTDDIDVDPAPPANQPPTANDDAATTDAGVAVTIPVRANDTDPEGTVLTIENVSDPVNGSVVNNGDGTVTYTPDAGFAGSSESFTYSASDGSLSDDATVTVTVNPAPPPPPAELGITTQPSAEATSRVVFDRQPVIQLLDGQGGSLPEAGVQISAEIASGEGQLQGSDSTTDATGQAVFTDLAIVGEGDFELAFSATGYTSVTSDVIDVEEDD